jgi:hypothetical protein
MRFSSCSIVKLTQLCSPTNSESVKFSNQGHAKIFASLVRDKPGRLYENLPRFLNSITPTCSGPATGRLAMIMVTGALRELRTVNMLPTHTMSHSRQLASPKKNTEHPRLDIGFFGPKSLIVSNRFIVMRRISLTALLVGSLIPPIVAYCARHVLDLVARGHKTTEILVWLAISLGLGICAAAAFCVVRRSA